MALEQEEPQFMWKCDTCDFYADATAENFARYGMSHIKEMKKQGEQHGIYLADSEGNPVADPHSGEAVRGLPHAQRLGFVAKKGQPLQAEISHEEPAPESQATTKEEQEETQEGQQKAKRKPKPDAQVAQIKPEIVQLDPKIALLYQWDVGVTGYSGTFSQWLLDVVEGFHIQNRDLLHFDRLFPNMPSQKQEVR